MSRMTGEDYGSIASETPPPRYEGGAETIAALAKLGHRLDGLALEVSALHERSNSISVQIAAAKEADASAAEELNALGALEMLREADARLSIARALASRAIDRRQLVCRAAKSGTNGTCLGQDDICPAFDAFQEAEKLDNSARDIVAVAILMPKASFEHQTTILGNNLQQLALHFRAPIGAVALRRRILHEAP